MLMVTDIHFNDEERPTSGAGTSTVKVLGINVTPELLLHWTSWFAPQSQPLLIPRGHRLESIGEPFDPQRNPEVRDTFEIYGEDERILHRSVDSKTFLASLRNDRAILIRLQVELGRSVVPAIRSWPHLSSSDVIAAGDGRRFLWWPHLIKGHEKEVLIRYVEEGRLPSRHREVPDNVWNDLKFTLPGARSIAGSFPLASGPNCFGTVMAAAGVDGAAQKWTLREPFEEWLAQHSVSGGSDVKVGTVLIWRSESGLVEHAAVTLGGGWALHKPSQGWMSPVKVLHIPEVIRSARSNGRRLTRRRLA